MAKQKKPTSITPWGTLGFSHLAEPDTEGKYADGKYKAQLIIDANDPWVEQFTEQCKEVAKQAWGRVPKALSLPLRDGDEIAADKELPELRGKVLINAKSKFPVGMADARSRAEIPLENAPRMGDVVKLKVGIATCEPSGNKTVNLYLNALLLKERRAGVDAVSQFSDEDFADVEEDDTPETGGDEDF